MVNCIVIGGGYWGEKVINSLKRIENVNIVGICDSNIDILKKYNNYKTFSKIEDINVEYNCVFIITRVNSHFYLAKHFLELGKHVFLEKPMTLEYKKAKELIKIAKNSKKILCLDHTFLFSHEIEEFKKIFNTNSKYIELKRVNNGPFSTDLNVIEDLCPHDFSILNFLVPYEIDGISANGISIINNVIEKAIITVYYKNTDFKAIIEVSWLEREKLRQIRLIDKDGEEICYKNNDNNLLLLNYKTAKIENRGIKTKESLLEELKHFIRCVSENKKSSIIDGKDGLKIVKLLEITNKSIKNKGKLIKLK